MTVTPENCRKCDRRMVPRGQARSPGVVHHGARGLCRGCHSVIVRNGATDHYPLGQRPHLHIVEDFTFIAESTGGRRNSTAIGWDKATRIRAAARLGVTVGALDRALYRNRAA